MDSSADSQNASSISSRKRKADVEESMNVVPSKRAKFLQTYRRQFFTLLDSIMHYIAKNPSSPEIYAKMVQTCKYFYIKNPVLIISHMSYQDGWKAVYNRKQINIDLDKVTSKLWIIDGLIVIRETANLASLILSKSYQNHAKILTLYYQHLSYNEVIALGLKVKHVDFYQVTVKYQDGTIVPFEKLFEAFPHVKSIQFRASPSVSMITAQSFVELLKIPHFSTLEHCMLQNIPDIFDIDNFYIYMKKNKCTHFDLHFSDSFSAAYKKRLEEIIDEIIGTENHNYKPPFIRFPGLDFTKTFQLHLLFYQQ